MAKRRHLIDRKTGHTLLAILSGRALLCLEVVRCLRCSVKGAGLVLVQVMITKIESSTEGARVKSGATVDDTKLRYGI
jgi:hypothetical protein